MKLKSALNNFNPSRQKLIKCKEEGAKFEYIGNSFLPYVKNVGIAEKRLQHDGKSIVTVYPTMTVHRSPLKFPNYKPEIPEENPFNKLKYADRFQFAFFKSRPKITEECIHSSEYYFEDGLRKVRPYYMVRECSVRGLEKPMTALEFENKVILDISKDEKIRLKFGTNKVFKNLEICRPEDMVENGDILSEIVHRHEKAVLDQPIEVIHENDDIVVINKPSTLPVYPIGQYRMNSATFILKKEFGYRNVKNAHRIDIGTSGVCIFAKDSSASKIHKMLENVSNISKEYIARVEGQFPKSIAEIDFPLTTNHLSNRTFKEKEAKNAFTQVELIEYDLETDTSLVRCRPKTGRTHQIRRHLAMSGHPIVNDESYNEKCIGYRFDYNLEEIKAIVDKLLERSQQSELQNVKIVPYNPDLENDDWKESLSRTIGRNNHFCIKCELGEEYERKVAKIVTVPLCLHSAEYQLPGLTLTAPWPKWATDIEHFKHIRRM